MTFIVLHFCVNLEDMLTARLGAHVQYEDDVAGGALIVRALYALRVNA